MNPTIDNGKIGQALTWLVTLLNEHQVQYQIVGGLAAQAYGAKRPLLDIDLYMAFDQSQAVLDAIKPYLTRLPAPHRSAAWDLVYLALEYEGVQIEIGDSSTDPRFYNGLAQRWESQAIDYTASQTVRLYGVDVAVMPKAELVCYKAMLDREVDHLDLQQLGDCS